MHFCSRQCLLFCWAPNTGVPVKLVRTSLTCEEFKRLFQIPIGAQWRALQRRALVLQLHDCGSNVEDHALPRRGFHFWWRPSHEIPIWIYINILIRFCARSLCINILYIVIHCMKFGLARCIFGSRQNTPWLALLWSTKMWSHNTCWHMSRPVWDCSAKACERTVGNCGNPQDWLKMLVKCCTEPCYELRMLFHVVPCCSWATSWQKEWCNRSWLEPKVLGPLLLKKAFRTGRRLFQSQRHGAQWERNGSARCRCSAIVSIARGTWGTLPKARKKARKHRESILEEMEPRRFAHACGACGWGLPFQRRFHWVEDCLSNFMVKSQPFRLKPNKKSPIPKSPWSLVGCDPMIPNRTYLNIFEHVEHGYLKDFKSFNMLPAWSWIVWSFQQRVELRLRLWAKMRWIRQRHDETWRMQPRESTGGKSW